MARSIQEILTILQDAKNADANLSLLNSGSQTADYFLWQTLVATAQAIQEGLFDVFKEEINTTLTNLRAGGLLWYVEKAKEFQLGDSVTVLPNLNVGYSVVDTTKRIVTLASSVEKSGNTAIKLKYAKGVIGSLSELTATESLQFQAYMEKVKFAGTNIEYVTLPADDIQITADIYADGLVPSATMTTRITDSINNYFNQLSFDGFVVVNDLIDYIRTNTENLVNIVITLIQGRNGGGGYTSFTVKRENIAGYCVLNSFTPTYI